jgi:cell wall-active antibiotic response 4TMS protein YvqF
MNRTYRYRSFFWPALLIFVGVVALLVNVGQIPVERVFEAVNLWPLILVVIGLELIIRRRLHGAGGDIAAALVVVLAIVAATIYVAAAPNPSATRTLDASASVDGLSSASLQVDVGGATLRISSDTTLGSDLYRVHIQYTGSRPTVELNNGGRLHIEQAGNSFPSLQGGRFTMDLALNTAIPWSIVENSGATAETMNVPDLNLTSLAINTGASREEILLGTPVGAVPIHINGGALTVDITRGGGTDATIKVSGGAVALMADGNTYHAIGSASYETVSQGSNRFVIVIDGGACTVTLDSTAP